MTQLGIIGAGRIGKLHAENISKLPFVKIKTISDVYTAGLKEWADPLGISRTTSDYSEIIHDPEIDAVLICSSTNTHPGIIIEAAKAGKHIFCEKPISFDLEQTCAALEAVRQSGVKFQVGFVRRFDPSFRKVQDEVRQGSIGVPHVIKITSRDPNPPSAEYLKSCGGLFLDQSIHDFDMARYLSGSNVVEVIACGAVLVDPIFQEFNDVDTAVITLLFENGAIGVIDNSRKAVYGYDQRIEVFGSEGCLTADNAAPTTVKRSSTNGVVMDAPPYFFLERYNDAFIQEIKQFIYCIRHGKEVPVTGYDGLQAELIAHAAKLSFMQNRPVKLQEIELSLSQLS